MTLVRLYFAFGYFWQQEFDILLNTFLTRVENSICIYINLNLKRRFAFGFFKLINYFCPFGKATKLVIL